MLLDGAAGRVPRPGRRPATPASPVIYQEPTLFPDLSGRREHLHGPPAARRAPRPHRPQGRACRTTAELLHAPRRRARPRPARPRPVHRGPADRRDRQGALVRRPRADHGRADRRPLRRRGRPALRRGARRLRDQGAAVLFISHRLDEVFAHLRARSPTLRDGRRIASEPLGGRRPRTTWCAGWSAATSTRCTPSRSTGSGETVLERAWADPRGRLPRRLLRGAGAARSSRSPGLVGAGAQRGRPRRLRRRPLRTPGEVAVGGRSRSANGARRPPPWPPGSPSSPRTAAPAGPGDGHVHRAQHRASTGLRTTREGPVSWTAAPSATGAARLGGRAPARSTPALADTVGTPVRRQPAEGRAGQVAGHRAPRC